MRTSSSQAEGARREFAAATLEFVGKNGKLTGVKCARVNERREPLPGTEFILRADLVFLAIGFAGPFANTFIEELKPQIATDRRGNISIAANELDYRTSVEKVYVAGDARRGQSLVVWAIREGRQAAHAIDRDLTGQTTLPR
jgi:glutamate synthase (NADPH/NADH) small chain